MIRETSSDFLRIDISNGKTRKIISACQADSVHRTIHFLLSNNGTPVDLSNIFYAEILIKRVNGTETDNPCIIDGDDICYALKSNDVSVVGENECHLMLTFNDGTVLETPVFYLNVFSSFYNQSALQSQNDYGTLVQHVLDAKGYKEDASEYASTAASEASTASEYANNALLAASEAIVTKSETDDIKSETADYLSSTSEYMTSASEYASTAGSHAAVTSSNVDSTSTYAASAASQASLATSRASETANYLSSTSEYMVSASEYASTAGSHVADTESNASLAASYMESASEYSSEAGSEASYANSCADQAEYWYNQAEAIAEGFAGSPVTGVKGDSESVYRRGNVNITPSNIGLGNVRNEDIGSGDISTYGANVKAAILTLAGYFASYQPLLTNPLTQADIVNVLTSTSTTAPLSAAQGKALNDALALKAAASDLTALASRVTALESKIGYPIAPPSNNE